MIPVPAVPKQGKDNIALLHIHSNYIPLRLSIISPHRGEYPRKRMIFVLIGVIDKNPQ
jgi:hypothetical protein